MSLLNLIITFVFHAAAANRHVDLINLIFNHVKSVTELDPNDAAVIPIFSERNGEGFKAALVNGYIKIVGTILQEEYVFSILYGYNCRKPKLY